MMCRRCSLCPGVAVLAAAVLAGPMLLMAATPAEPPAPAKPSAEPAAAPQANGQAILDAAREAASKFSTLSYDVTFDFDSGRGDAKYGAQASVIMKRAGETSGTPDHFLVTGSMVDPMAQEPAKFIVAHDGTTFRAINHTSKTWYDEPSAGGQFFEPGMMMVLEDFNSSGAPRMGDVVKVESKGRESVKGVDCDHVVLTLNVLVPADMHDDADDEDEDADDADAEAGDDGDDDGEFDMPEMKEVQVTTDEWYAVSDRLLRMRVERYPSMPGEENITPTMTISLTNVAVNPPVEDAVFTPAAPDGYEMKKPANDLESMLAGAKIKAGDVAPDWTLKDGDGVEHSLSQCKGKVVVMDFWATWCGPCKLAMPGIQKVHEQFKDKPVAVFGISINDTGDPVKYMAKKKYTYTGLVKGEEVAAAYGVGPIPQFFVIGKDGVVVHHSIGFEEGHEEKLAAIIEEALAKE